MSTAVLDDSILFTLDITPFKTTDREFYRFCQRNKDFRFEMTAEGELIIESHSPLEISRKKMSGEDVLIGFELNPTEIW